jgi:hypothetical protein
MTGRQLEDQARLSCEFYLEDPELPLHFGAPRKDGLGSKKEDNQ